MEIAAEEHTLVDAADREISGREAVRQAWEGFFGLFPDYRISFDQIVGSQGVVGIFGTASGTAAGGGPEDERHWSIPVAWKAVVRGDRVAHWQVYCETGRCGGPWRSKTRPPAEIETAKTAAVPTPHEPVG
jgi:hypothetical protein